MTNSFGLLKLLIVITLIFNGTYSMGQYLEPTTKTNINQIDPLFEENIDNYQGWQNTLDKARESAIEASGNSEESADPKVKSEIDRLSNISANELEGQGRQERAAKPWVDDFFVDYSKAGGRQHQSDAELIANSSGKLMNKLTSLLKDLGVDCQEVKGNKEVEPQYYLELQREKVRDDTVYDQFFCEQLRNSYSCREQLIMSCKRQGMIWQSWQDRIIVFSGDEISNLYRDWFYPVFLKKHRSFGRRKTVYSLHIRNNSSVIRAARVAIAGKLEVTLEHIDQSIVIPYQGEGNLTEGWDGDIVKWDRYIFYYKYRDGYLACLEWQEEWSEQCLLN